MFRYSLFILTLFLLNGCYSFNHQGFVDSKDAMVGRKLMNCKPYKYENAGEIIRGNFLKQGDGFTHITTNNNGDHVFHYFIYEILPTFSVKKWVGKCLIYIVVDPKTDIVKDWGFDEGGNHLSCSRWS